MPPLGRLGPLVLIAASLALLAAGLLAFAPMLTGDGGDARRDVEESTFITAPPSTTPHVDPAPSLRPTVRPDATPSATTLERAFATRIAVPAMGIDLAVLPGDDEFPLCDVAQYLREYSQPGEPGTTYIYAHARRGMFLPLLEASREPDNGASMLDMQIEVYTSAGRLHLYEVHVVKRHATDLSLAHELPPAGEQLILQTSEGPPGTINKLQVAALPIDVVEADELEAFPEPSPRACD